MLPGHHVEVGERGKEARREGRGQKEGGRGRDLRAFWSGKGYRMKSGRNEDVSVNGSIGQWQLKMSLGPSYVLSTV